jgi:hypothetical protein
MAISASNDESITANNIMTAIFFFRALRSLPNLTMPMRGTVIFFLPRSNYQPDRLIILKQPGNGRSDQKQPQGDVHESVLEGGAVGFSLQFFEIN